MTTNADRPTQHEYETTNALIAEARATAAQPHITLNDIKVPINTNATFFDRARSLLAQMADALEASEAQVARLTVQVRAQGETCKAYYCQGGGERLLDLPTKYPADLLEAVRLIVVDDSLKSDRRAAVATLRRYGLMPEEAR